MKTCKKCGIETPLVNFPKAPGCRDGHSGTCKSCVLKGNQARDLIKRPIETRPQYQAKVLFDQGLKKCAKCGDIKSLGQFHRCSKRFTADGGYKASCKQCASAQFKAWKSGHKEHLAEYARVRSHREDVVAKNKLHRRRRTSLTPRVIMQITLRHGLIRVPTENPATIDDLMAKFAANDGKCALTGIAMTWAKGKVLPTSISLDRIDPDQGYSDDNLRLICHAINSFKGRMSDDEMFGMALALIGNMKRPKLKLVS